MSEGLESESKKLALLTLRESVNPEQLEWIMVNLDTFVIPQERKKFTNYYLHIKHDHHMVTYYRDNEHGRYQATDALSLQGLSKRISTRLARGVYHDIDMENCHPILLLNICREHNWEVPELRYYVENREDALKSTGAPRKDAKTAFITVIYGGFPKIGLTPFIQRFRNEMRKIAELVFTEYPHVEYKKKSTNPQFSRLSKLLQHNENECMMEMATYFRMQGYEIGVYMFDGMMIYRKSEGPLNVGLLRECETHLLTVTGHVVKLAEKEV